MIRTPPDKARRIYLLRSLLAPTVSYRWTKFIRAFHEQFGAPEPVERILSKTVRSYLIRKLWPHQRLSMLLAHYKWFGATFSDDLLSNICSYNSIEIAAIKARKNSCYYIYLASSMVAILQREGELALYIAKSRDDQKLSRLSFTFQIISGEPAFIIGGLQGPSTNFKRDVIDATREMFGLRPKDALLFALRHLAVELGVKSIHAISDSNHILGRLQDKTKFSNYDAYWLERGAVAAPPYGFVFGPLQTSEGPQDKREGAKMAIAESVRDFGRSVRREATDA